MYSLQDARMEPCCLAQGSRGAKNLGVSRGRACCQNSGFGALLGMCCQQGASDLSLPCADPAHKKTCRPDPASEKHRG